MLNLLSGCTFFRIKVPLEIDGKLVDFDLHLRISGGINWEPYLDSTFRGQLGSFFSTLDPVIYKRFLFVIMEVNMFFPVATSVHDVINPFF